MTAPPLLLTDRYPCPVTCPDGSKLSRARVLLTAPEPAVEPRLLVFTAADSPPVVDVVWVPAASSAGSLQVDWRIATGDGVYLVHPSRGCRCGRLGHWSPFGGPQRSVVGMTVPKVIARAREAAA